MDFDAYAERIGYRGAGAPTAEELHTLAGAFRRALSVGQAT